jgi:hypothetical protein
VGDRFWERDRGPACDDLTWTRLDGAEPLTGGTGELAGELLGLAVCELFESTFDQPGCGSGGNLLHLVEVHVEPRSAFTVSPACNDLSPLFGEIFDGCQLLR